MSFLRPAQAALAVLAIAALPARPAAAFTDALHRDIAEQAVRLAPSSLRSILGANAASLREGASAPVQVGADGLVLLADGSAGSLDQTVARQAQRVLDLLTQRAPMSMIAREMGVLSRVVSLASDPLHVVPPDARTNEWAADFERFTEERRPRFRLAFGGYASPELDRDDVPGFVRASAARARRQGSILGEMFVTSSGPVASAASFDDRHPVFGVAALGYSHAITDTARIWLHAWVKAGGDAAGLPFPQSLPGGPAADAR